MTKGMVEKTARMVDRRLRGRIGLGWRPRKGSLKGAKHCGVEQCYIK
jgi:hypothetical protein